MSGQSTAIIRRITTTSLIFSLLVGITSATYTVPTVNVQFTSSTHTDEELGIDGGPLRSRMPDVGGMPQRNEPRTAVRRQ